MPQVLGDGLNWIFDPNNTGCVGMAEVMEAGLRDAYLRDNSLQVLQDSVVD